MENSNLEWTDHTFNPVRGCTKVSPGCAHCYAETLSKRNPKVLGGWGPGAPRVVAAESYWQQPLKWNAVADSFRECSRCHHRAHMHEGCMMCGCDTAPARQRVFCASLSDWLDPEWPIEALARLLDLIRLTPNLDWLLLTKRPENFAARMDAAFRHVLMTQPLTASEWIADWLGYKFRGHHNPTIPANVWIGTSVEDQSRADERIPALLAIPARVRFLSCEPLLGPVDLRNISARGGEYDALDGDWLSYPYANGVLSTRTIGRIDWVVAGGESGPGARPMHPAWARGLRDQCAAAGVPFLFKQWGGTDKKSTGRELDGRTWDELPSGGNK